MAQTLTITLNAAAHETGAVTLAELIIEQGHADVKIATAVNGAFVAARARGETKLKVGDRIEIVTARQGG